MSQHGFRDSPLVGRRIEIRVDIEVCLWRLAMPVVAQIVHSSV